MARGGPFGNQIGPSEKKEKRKPTTGKAVAGKTLEVGGWERWNKAGRRTTWRKHLTRQKGLIGRGKNQNEVQPCAMGGANLETSKVWTNAAQRRDKEGGHVAFQVLQSPGDGWRKKLPRLGKLKPGGGRLNVSAKKRTNQVKHRAGSVSRFNSKKWWGKLKALGHKKRRKGNRIETAELLETSKVR